MNTLMFIMMFSGVFFLNDKDAIESMEEAYHSFQASDYEEALDKLDDVIDIESEAYEAYFLRALSHSYVGNHQESINDYTFISDVKYMKRHVIFNNRGLEYAKINKNLEAIKDFTKAIEIYPKFAEAYNNRGHQLEEIGNYQGALIDYHKSIELADREDLAIYLYNAARLESVIGSENLAINLLNQALDLQPDFVEAKSLKDKFSVKFANIID